jgi:hypothetical protein
VLDVEVFEVRLLDVVTRDKKPEQVEHQDLSYETLLKSFQRNEVTVKTELEQ